MLPCSLDSALPKESSLLLQLFYQGQANDLHKGTNHSNTDGSCMNVQRDLACVTCFQSHLRSIKYLWFHLIIKSIVLTCWMPQCYREALNLHRQHMQRDEHFHDLSDLILMYMYM